MSARHVVARATLGAAGPVLERLPAVGPALGAELTVFAFHDVTSAPSAFQRTSRTSTDPAVFDRQVRWISAHFDVVSPRRLLDGGPLPQGSALLTFDDAWAGVWETALPMLRARRLPALLFLNMATVLGDPDLAAVEQFELERVAPADRVHERGRPVDVKGTLAAVQARYRGDAAFAAYQGQTAGPAHLEQHDGDELVSYGSHLFHHWRSNQLTSEGFATSFKANQQALEGYRSFVPFFAFPYGAIDRDFRPEQVEQARCLGASGIFTLHGTQNRPVVDGMVDRIGVPVDDPSSVGLWYASHLGRIKEVFRRLARGGSAQQIPSDG